MPPHSPWVQLSRWRHLGFPCCGAQPLSPSAFKCTGARKCVACNPHSPSIGRFARSSGRRGSLAPWCFAGRPCLSPFVHPLKVATGAALSTVSRSSARPLRWFYRSSPEAQPFRYRWSLVSVAVRVSAEGRPRRVCTSRRPFSVAGVGCRRSWLSPTHPHVQSSLLGGPRTGKARVKPMLFSLALHPPSGAACGALLV